MSGTELDRLHAKTWFGHPRGLTILFLTEMWDQFSFFGMRALLVYYMTKELLITQSHSSYIYGLYSSFVYFTPLIGGVISDRWLGRRRAVVIGGSIMALGHFMMAFEPAFYFALATIALGNGLFLPSLSSQINELYAPDDPRRATAYNIYYVGINLGAFLAPFVCGTVGELYGWHWGFALAGVGMLIGLFTYLGGARYLPKESSLAERRQQPVVQRPRTRMEIYLLFVAVIAIVVVFRAAYEQSGNTLALWADTGIDRHIGHSFLIPMTWFQSLNPLIIFLFTPVIVMYWTRAAKRGKEPGSVGKMATGGFIVGVSYLMLALVAHLSGDARASWLWLALFFLIYTVGELFILPVGLGLFGKLAPVEFAATAIAAWFMAAFFGNLAAGAMGALWSVVSVPVFFVIAGAVAFLSGLLLFALTTWAHRIETDAAASDPDIAVAALAADTRH
ncbi:MAG TPA: peptide MFS transporter [Rhizomicrobium sp.]|jgi:POT family proton-dependent oligopeptide transporter